MFALYCFVLMLIISATCTADSTVGDLEAGFLDEITAILNGVFTVTGHDVLLHNLHKLISFYIIETIQISLSF